MNTLPRNFTEVAGWREAFREAAEALDKTRTASLFATTEDFFGIPLRPLSLRDWSLLTALQNSYVLTGPRQLKDALWVAWYLSEQYIPGGTAKATRSMRRFFGKAVELAQGNVFAILERMDKIFDDAFIDSPGRFSGGKKASGHSPTNWPRTHAEIALCGEVLTQFPSFTHTQLATMPLAQFWQWLAEARMRANPEYRHYQYTDAVNSAANERLNELRKQAAESKKQ